MSQDDPQLVEAKQDDDVELMLVDEIGEGGPASNGTDDEVLLVEETTFFTEEILAMEKKAREEADRFFDIASPSNVASLAVDTRQSMAKYCAALFEWFCCLPSVEHLTIHPDFDALNLPFPVTPDKKRALIRRDFGVRLADVWRQTKSTEKMANHFKLQEGVALLTLLDYAFKNASHELDVVPLLKQICLDKNDYYVVAAFIMANCDPQLWKDPEALIEETLMSPIEASLSLYMLSTDCVRGRMMAIPWEELNTISIKDIPAEDLAKFDEVLLESQKQLMEARAPLLKKCQKVDEQLNLLYINTAAIRKEREAIEKQMEIDSKMIEEICARYVNIELNRNGHISAIKPDRFDENGEALAKADDEIIVEAIRDRPDFRQHLYKDDVVQTKGAVVLVRRTEDAAAPFEPAIFDDYDPSDPTCAFISFAAEPAESMSVPLANIAIGSPARSHMPVSCEGLRVAALTRHPCHPEKPAIYSGTVIGRYNVHQADCAVMFDDFFDEYVPIAAMYIMLVQSFRDEDGVLERRYSYMAFTKSAAAPQHSDERRIFLLYFLSKYPDWGLIKMADRVGSMVAAYDRAGQPVHAYVLALDRQMVWLRFDEIKSSSGEPCRVFPCTAHKHLDEKIYRGSVRLKQFRSSIAFEKVLTLHKATGVAALNRRELQVTIMKGMSVTSSSRTEQRRVMRLQRANGIILERAVPEVKREGGQGVQIAQTARKCGTGLHIEPIVRGEKVKRKKEVEVVIKRHEVKPLTYSPDSYHAQCGHECLKDEDDAPSAERFRSFEISPYYVPVLCGWRRVKQDYSFASKIDTLGKSGNVYYRAPCGRPLYRMDEVIDYLQVTRSELTVDLFCFSTNLDETTYVEMNKDAMVLEDLSCGAEARPIPVVNEVDREALPPFNYRARRYPLNEKVEMTTTNKGFCSGCDCTDDCSDWTKCACQRLTHREAMRFKHSAEGNRITKGYTNRLLLFKQKSGIYECNENCGCSRRRCINRVVQNDLKVPQQMYKTASMGWGVRAIVDIPHGTFISCYHGAILSDLLGETNNEGDEYYADIDFYNQSEESKEGAHVDLLGDGGFVEDVGLRDLTLEEIAEAEGEDELSRFRRTEDEQKHIRRSRGRGRPSGAGTGAGAGGAREVKEEAGPSESRDGMMMEVDEEEDEATRRARRQEMRAEMRDELSEDETQDGSGDGVEEEMNEGEEEGGANGGGGEEEAVEDDDGDEGIEEGDSLDEEEEEQPVSSPDVEKRQEEEEERKRMEVERKDEAARRRDCVEKGRREIEAAKKRFNIPLIDDDQKYQLDNYFELASCDYLFLLDAKSAGNIGRQYNHSCAANMFTQHVFVDTHDIRLPWVAFFAARDIKAGEELTWDYGWHPDPNKPRGLKCHCGAEECRVDLL